MTLTFRLADRQRRLARVWLAQEVGIADVEFERVPGGWQLDVVPPAVARMEYLFELEDHNGRRWTITDPAAELRAPGAFGDKSVREFEGYERPAWLDAQAVHGTLDERRVPALGGEAMIGLWTPTGLVGDAPLILVHDGPEFAALGGFVQWLGAMIASDVLPPTRAALLDPGDRNDWYAANRGYAEAMAGAVATLPATRVVGVGASLGALAMLHLHRVRPGTIDALFLQSGSFFTAEFDAQESGFSGFGAVTDFVRGLHEADADPAPVPTVLTCGTVEENLSNNRAMTATLQRLGYDAELHERPDAHNFTAWRDALHPLLTGLARRAA